MIRPFPLFCWILIFLPPVLLCLGCIQEKSQIEFLSEVITVPLLFLIFTLLIALHHLNSKDTPPVLIAAVVLILTILLSYSLTQELSKVGAGTYPGNLVPFKTISIYAPKKGTYDSPRGGATPAFSGSLVASGVRRIDIDNPSDPINGEIYHLEDLQRELEKGLEEAAVKINLLKRQIQRKEKELQELPIKERKLLSLKEKSLQARIDQLSREIARSKKLNGGKIILVPLIEIEKMIDQKNGLEIRIMEAQLETEKKISDTENLIEDSLLNLRASLEEWVIRQNSIKARLEKIKKRIQELKKSRYYEYKLPFDALLVEPVPSFPREAREGDLLLSVARISDLVIRVNFPSKDWPEIRSWANNLKIRSGSILGTVSDYRLAHLPSSYRGSGILVDLLIDLSEFPGIRLYQPVEVLCQKEANPFFIKLSKGSIGALVLLLVVFLLVSLGEKFLVSPEQINGEANKQETKQDTTGQEKQRNPSTPSIEDLSWEGEDQDGEEPQKRKNPKKSKKKSRPGLDIPAEFWEILFKTLEKVCLNYLQKPHNGNGNGNGNGVCAESEEVFLGKRFSPLNGTAKRNGVPKNGRIPPSSKATEEWIPEIEHTKKEKFSDFSKETCNKVEKPEESINEKSEENSTSLPAEPPKDSAKPEPSEDSPVSDIVMGILDVSN